jgi:hypothetical protein
MFLFKKIVAPLFFPVSLCLEILILGLFLLFTLYRKLKMDPIPVPAGHRVKQGQGDSISPHDFYPDPGALVKAQRAVYEYLGIAWARLRNQI